MARSNRLAQIIPEMLFSQEPDFPAVTELLKEYPARIDTLTRYGRPLVETAINQDRTNTLAFLLAQKLDPNAHAPQDQPLLLQVMIRSRWDLAVMLIKAGASVTVTNNEGMNAGGMLFSNWYPGTQQPLPNELATLLLTSGVDVFARHRNGSDASILEQCLNREETLSYPFFGELLLTNNASPARRTPLGDTALHLAVQYRHTNAVEFLLQSGFDINQTNNAGLTPLQERVGAGQAGALVGPNPSTAVRMIPGSVIVLPGSRIMLSAPPALVPAAAASGPTNTPPPAPLTIAEYLLAHGATLDIFSAAGLGRTNGVAAMLATNPALAKARDSYGRTPLHYALLNHAWSAGAPMSRTPVPPVITLLLSSGADPSAATTSTVPSQRNYPALVSGTTPLHLAARLGDTPVLRALLAARANVQLADADGDTALHLAARTRQTNAITLLLSARAPIEVTNRQGHTPLRAAVESLSTDAVALLLDAGANRTNGLGSNTLLHIAATCNDVNSTALLLQRRFAIESRDGSGNTPLQVALLARSWNTAKLLRDEGANLNATNDAGDTALHLLATQQNDIVYHAPEEPFYIQWERRQIGNNGWLGRGLAWLMKNKLVPQLPAQGWTNSSLSDWLIEHGAQVNLTNRAGQNPLGVLCSAGWVRWYEPSQSSNRVVALLDAGARLDQPDTNGLSPLHLAAPHASPSFLSLLLAKAGTNLINQPDGRGRTLLHTAVPAATENSDRVNFLLAAGADVNAADHDGSTPLHVLMAIPQANAWMQIRQRDLAVLLLTNKANPNLQDKQGRTPLAIAISRPSANEPWGQRRVLLTLLSNGADPDIADTNGNTAAHLYFQGGVTNPGLEFNITDGLPTALLQKSDLTRTNRAGLTALHQLAKANFPNFHILHFFDGLVSPTNAAWEVRDPGGNTPLHLLALAGQDCGVCADVLAKLIVIGSRASLTNNSGQTPLMIATERASPALVERLRQLPAAAAAKVGK